MAQRYGKASGARIYQLQKEIAQTVQGSLSVAAYFSKLKSLWDEYSVVINIPTCTCTVGPQTVQLVQSKKTNAVSHGVE